jgi:hypothetical protein
MMAATRSTVLPWTLAIVFVVLLLYGIVYALREFLTPAIR